MKKNKIIHVVIIVSEFLMRKQKILLIRGGGEIKDYPQTHSENVPRHSLRDRVERALISDRIKSVGEHAFSCSSMKFVIIPESVTAIKDHALCNCPSLTSTTIPEDVDGLRCSGFSVCSSLSLTAIPKTITVLKNFAMDSCSRLRTIVIPKGVKEIYQRVLSGCTFLSSINIDKESE